MFKENFSNRHIGPNSFELDIILKTIGVESVEELLNQTIPDNIRLKKDLENKVLESSKDLKEKS